MKKFYTALALGVAVSLSAAAAPYNRTISFVPAENVNLETMSIQDVQMKKSFNETLDTRAAADLATDYEVLHYCNLLPSSTATEPYGYQGSFFQIKNVDGVYKLSGLAYDYEATVTLGDNTISIAPQNLGVLDEDGTQYNVELIHKRWNDDGKGSYDVTTPIVFTWDDKYQEFGTEWQDLLGVCLYKKTTNELAGYFFMSYYVRLMPLASSLASSDWKSAGTAKFSDGFLSPAFTSTGEAVEWDVPVEVSVKNPSLIRLVNPYGVGVAPKELTSFNGSQVPGSIWLNIANPKTVYVIPGIYSGMYNKEYLEPYYCTNYPGYYRYYEDMTDEDILDGFTEEELGTLEGATVTIPQSAFGVTPYYTLTNNQTQTTFNTPFEIYNWTTADGDPVYVNSVIKLPADAVDGVEEIGAEEMNAPVKYYNLQGVEIAAPAKGELVIKKQGSKATKAIVR